MGGLPYKSRMGAEHTECAADSPLFVPQGSKGFQSDVRARAAQPQLKGKRNVNTYGSTFATLAGFIRRLQTNKSFGNSTSLIRRPHARMHAEWRRAADPSGRRGFMPGP